MSTTTEIKERIAGRVAATDLAEDLAHMSDEYRKAFCIEIAKWMRQNNLGDVLLSGDDL